MKKLFLTFAVILSAALFSNTTQFAQSARQGAVLGYASSMSISGLLSGHNAQRSAYGLSPLRLNSKLSNAAQRKANDMVANNYWAHTSPSGTTAWYFITSSGYSYSMAGENLAYGYDSASAVITGWMNSSSHRANILKAGYKDVGFGVANSSNYVGTGAQTIVVAEYGAPTYSAPAPAPAPTTTTKTTTTTRTAAPKPAPAPAPAPVKSTPAPAPAPAKIEAPKPVVKVAKKKAEPKKPLSLLEKIQLAAKQYGKQTAEVGSMGMATVGLTGAALLASGMGITYRYKL